MQHVVEGAAMQVMQHMKSDTYFMRMFTALILQLSVLARFGPYLLIHLLGLPPQLVFAPLPANPAQEKQPSVVSTEVQSSGMSVTSHGLKPHDATRHWVMRPAC